MENEYRILPCVDADAVRKSTASAIQQGTMYAEKLATRLKVLGGNLEIEASMIDRCRDETIMTNIQEISDDVFSAIRVAANNLYRTSLFPSALSAMSNPQEEEKRYYEEIVIPTDEVRSFLEPDAIYVRTPMLWSRQSRRARTIGPQTARDILTKLGLYDQYADYQSFIDGQEPYFSLIQEFEVPLRRLKDE